VFYMTRVAEHLRLGLLETRSAFPSNRLPMEAGAQSAAQAALAPSQAA
jgi:hypothetical protein